MITGLTAGTFEKLQLDAGIFLKNMNWSTATDAAALKTLIASEITTGTNVLGATRGGGTFSATPTTREVEADGVRAPFVGSTRIDMWDIKLTTTLLEMKPDNFKIALGTGNVTDATGGNMHTITCSNDVSSSNYINKVQWVGETSKGLIMIEIDNALGTSGLNFTFTDKSEGTIPIELTAHCATALNQNNAPFRIVIFDTATTPTPGGAG